MTSVMEEMTFAEKIRLHFFTKTPLNEIYYPSNLPRDFKTRMRIRRYITIETRFRDAEKMAFKKARNLAKRLGYSNIFYSSYSGMNEDFMNGTSRKPRKYSIDAVLFN